MLTTVDKDIAQMRLIAATEEMSLVLRQASQSLYVKDTADFACAVADLSGRFIAYPQGIGVSGFLGMDLTDTVERIRSTQGLSPGDVILTNDPYLSQGLSTHLPDVHAIEPYFLGDDLIGYGWTFIHVSDIGGRVASSVSVRNKSIFSEGLRIPPVKYIVKGELSPSVQAFLDANSRTPVANSGDLRAMLASLARGRERVTEIASQLGPDGFAHVGEHARSTTAARGRSALAQLRDGEYSFSDYLDGDGSSEIPLRVRLTATVSAGRIMLDFTGTDPQVESALNMVTKGRPHSWVVTRIFALVGTLVPDIPLNGGLMDLIDFRAPVGCLLNAVEPAAVGVRHATTSRVNDVISGALIQAAPRILPAASSGLVVPVVFAQPERASVHVVEPMVGGTGARYGADGIDGHDSGISNLSNNPVEAVETNTSVRVLEYGIRAGSGGCGRWRGGCGLILRFEALEEGELLARGLERLRFRPWGYAGGGPGACARLTINEGRPGERTLWMIDVEPLQVGDIVTLRTSGAGGYGNPLERDPEAVLGDVNLGLVSVDSAQNDYGVAIVGGHVDNPRTAVLRSVDRHGEPTGTGPERDRWDRVFSDSSLDDLAAILANHEISARAGLRRGALGRALDELPPGFPASQSDQRGEARAREAFSTAVDELRRRQTGTA